MPPLPPLDHQETHVTEIPESAAFNLTMYGSRRGSRGARWTCKFHNCGEWGFVASDRPHPFIRHLASHRAAPAWPLLALHLAGS